MSPLPGGARSLAPLTARASRLIPWLTDALRGAGQNGFLVAWGLLAAWSVASDGQIPDQHRVASSTNTLFIETVGVIPLEERSRRKWDSPVVADFDCDGWLDVLLTDHSYRAQIYWNDNGAFSQPQVIVRGDTHGVAVGDYDRDGRLDLIISRGGGGGKKPRNPVTYRINYDRTIEGGEEFSQFERTRGRAAKLVDWDNDGLLDLVLSAFPLKSQPQGANHLYKNDGRGGFEFVRVLPQAAWMGYRALVTDFDNDGRQDIIFYGGKDMVAVRAVGGMGASDVTESVLGSYALTDYVSGITEIDFDNDGDFDLFLTREDHPFDPKTYFDHSRGRFAFFSRFKPSQYEDFEIRGDFKLENLQMAYPHFDVLVGADKRLLTFDVERHGHKDLTVKPENAAGWPADRSRKGLYIGYLRSGVWRMEANTSSPTTGVVHNLISKPAVKPERHMPAILLENRGGSFVDVTRRFGIAIPDQCSSATAGDFDNDGWCDLVVIRRGSPATETEHILYRNEGGNWFTRSADTGLLAPELGSTGSGSVAFDYDADGDLDILFGTERGRWRLFENAVPTCNDNHFLVVSVGRSPSGDATPLGATLTVRAGGQTYRRVVGASSAAFSQVHNHFLHLGLGKCTHVDEAVVRWTNGESAELSVNLVDQRVEAGLHDRYLREDRDRSGAQPK
ncbi:FG-GAP repeat protein [Planctomycetes bacterium MalM25]|nr:FG-GAP repeat protein [Planctomycetes bacterium MalM25]